MSNKRIRKKWAKYGARARTHRPGWWLRQMRQWSSRFNANAVQAITGGFPLKLEPLVFGGPRTEPARPADFESRAAMQAAGVKDATYFTCPVEIAGRAAGGCGRVWLWKEPLDTLALNRARCPCGAGVGIVQLTVFRAEHITFWKELKERLEPQSGPISMEAKEER